MDKYQNFFDSINQYIAKRNQQKENGVNDYNMVNVVRKENAEVGMHSNVIYSLIDPDGLHYRGKLFLNLFIQHVLKIKIEDFGEIISVRAEESTTEATVKNRRIDFTIKSTKYYVGIEMKIDVADLPQQISDYEKDLKEKIDKDLGKTVRIYYLTKDGRSASDHSLYDKDKEKKTETINISFKKHIIEWIESCQKEVNHIQNLHLALKNYKEIVEKITGQYKGKLMTFEDYLKDKATEETERILDEIDKMQESVSVGFIKKLDEYLGELEGKKEPSYSYIDISMGKYTVRLYFNQSNSTLLLQIGDKENPFISVSDEKRGVFSEKYLSKILEKINLGNLKWPIGYGEINLGKVRFQTRDKILEKAKNITSKLSLILSNE